MTSRTPTRGSTKPTLLERAEAEAWLVARVRQLLRLFLLSVAVSPVAVTVVLGVRQLIRGRGFPPIGGFFVAVGLWTAIVLVIIAFVVALMVRRRLAFAKRVRPVVREGTERRGEVTVVGHGSRQRAGVTFHSVTVTVALPGGALVKAFIEESEGTELPEVEVGAPATIWTLGPRAVVGTSGSLFESV